MRQKLLVFFFISILMMVDEIAKGDMSLPKKKIDNVAVCVLFDLSSSTIPWRTKYLEAFKYIMFNLRYGSVIEVVKITESSITEADIFLEYLPRPTPKTDNPLEVAEAKKIADKSIKDLRENLTKDIEKVLLSQSSGATDIMTSLDEAERFFTRNKEYRSILIIFSDMVETAKYNFAETLTTNRTNEILQKEEVTDRLPIFDHVEVFVVAASSGGSDDYIERRQFWLHFFNKCKADIRKENYGSAYKSVLPLSFYSLQ